MSIANHIKSVLNLPTFVVNSYLNDLTDDDLMRRPAPFCNHIKWQLGHLIASEHDLQNKLVENCMPALPAGFADKHQPETAGSDNPADFLSKEEYLLQMNRQRQGTLSLLDRITDPQLETPAPDYLQMFGDTVGAIIAGQATHWMMHAGQWAVLRRQLGKPPLF